MKISRKKIMAARKAVKASSGYYEITNYVDGIPQEIRILDRGVKFRVVRKNDGFKVLALKQGGHFDYSVETFNTPEEAADAMIQDTCTFRNRSLWDVKSATRTRKTPIKADAADVFEPREYEQYCVYDADTLEIIDVLEDKDSAIARADEYRRKHPSAYVAIDYQIVDEDGELLSDDDNSVIYAPDPVESSTRTRKTPVRADAADVREIRDQQYVEDFFYDIEINGNPLGTYYEKLEDAIEIAQQYASDPQYADDEIAVVIRHQLVDDVAGEIIDTFDDDGAAEWRSDDYLYESKNVHGKAVMASAGHDPYSLIKERKDAFIEGWMSEYDGEPKTSWGQIFNNVLEEFRTYCGDEASDFIIDEYNEGRYTEGDMMSAFEQFIMWLDIAEYDF